MHSHTTAPKAPPRVDLDEIQTAIEHHLEGIEKILGPNYKLTLIARYAGPLPLKDASLMLSMDDGRESVMSVVDRFLPAKG